MRTICFLSVLLFSVVLQAQKLLVTADYALDTASVWQFGKLPQTGFKPFKTGETLNIGYNKNTAVWCRIKIRNPRATAQKTWLAFDNNHLDSIVLYDGGKPKILGDRTPNSGFFLSEPAFLLELKPHAQRIFYAKVKKGISAMAFSVSLKTEKSLAHWSNLKMALVSFLLGIIVLLVLFNAILFSITRSRLYTYYILYSLLSAVYIMVTAGYAKHLLFPDFLYFSEIRIYSASLWLISLTAFLCFYLDMRRWQPLRFRIIFILNCLNVSNIIVTIGLLYFNHLDGLKYFMAFGYLNFMAVILLILTAAIQRIKKDPKTALYILVAFVPQCIWGLAIILKFFNLVPKNLHEDWLVIISLYEVFLFGYVLARNYVDTFRRNNELNRELLAQKEKSIETITQTQIRERRNLANIIHDNVGSKIAYVLQLLHLKDWEAANANMKALAGDIREISHQILPKALDDGALASSLQNQINTLDPSFAQTEIELLTYDFPEKIAEAWVYDLYLISVEILNNALKHARAQSIVVELYGYPENYVFQFTDDGIGFDPAKTPKGFGLENIEKRVAYYKGAFELNSFKGEGTVIQISLPRA